MHSAYHISAEWAVCLEDNVFGAAEIDCLALAGGEERVVLTLQ